VARGEGKGMPKKQIAKWRGSITITTHHDQEEEKTNYYREKNWPDVAVSQTASHHHAFGLSA
jgi:hypothetical protein